MNASDIIKAKQSKVLYQAYYRPKIFPGITNNGVSTLITSTINYYPISSLSTSGSFVSSFDSTITINYAYTCEKPIISYELENAINSGKLLCGFPYCSTISEWNTSQTFPVGECDCKINVLTWKNTNPTMIYNVSTVNYSSVVIQSTQVLTGPLPGICPSFKTYETATGGGNTSISYDFKYFSPISSCNTSEDCHKKLSVLTWKNTNSTLLYNFSNSNYSTTNIESTTVLTGPTPIVCPIFNYYEGNIFDNKGSVIIDYYI
jgi:hypothetical protein